MISAHLRRSRAISQSRVASTPLAERLVRVRYGEIRGDIGEISGDIGRYRGDIGVMGRYGEMRGDMGRSPRARRSRVGSRYGEIWGDLGRDGERWGEMEIEGDMGRHGKMWVDMRRYGETRGDVGCAPRARRLCVGWSRPPRGRRAPSPPSEPSEPIIRYQLQLAGSQRAPSAPSKPRPARRSSLCRRGRAGGRACAE